MFRKQRRHLLCRLGLHKEHPTMYYENKSYKHNTITTSKSAFCQRCGVRLRLISSVDKVGKRKGKYLM